MPQFPNPLAARFFLADLKLGIPDKQSWVADTLREAQEAGLPQDIILQIRNIGDAFHKIDLMCDEHRPAIDKLLRENQNGKQNDAPASEESS